MNFLGYLAEKLIFAPKTIVFSDNNGKSTATLTYSSKGYYNASGKAFSVKETTK